jgi:hypothetical protein
MILPTPPSPTWIKDKLSKKQDKLTQGSGISIKNNVVSADIAEATQTSSGLMSAEDKSKLDNVASTYLTIDTEQVVTGSKVFTGVFESIATAPGVYLGMDTNRTAPNVSISIVSANSAAYMDFGVPDEDYGFRIIKWNGHYEDVAQLRYADAILTVPRASGTLALVEQIPDVSGFAKKTDVPDVSGFVTQETLSGYATIGQIPDVSGFAKKTEIPDVSGFAKKTDVPDVSGFATKSEVSLLPTFEPKVVSALPTSDISTKALYLVPSDNGPNDQYDQYIYINSQWEKIGSGMMTVDASMSSTSTNPVQNKVIFTELSKKLDSTGGTISGNLTIARTDDLLGTVGTLTLGDKVNLGALNGMLLMSADQAGVGLDNTTFSPVGDLDLGSTTLPWKTIYGTTIYQNGVKVATVDDLAGLGSGGGSGGSGVMPTTYVKSITAPGAAIIVTNGDDTTQQISVSDVVQIESSSKNAELSLLTTSSKITSTGTRTVAETRFSNAVTLNPSTGAITATSFRGTADKAVADADGNTITSTYLPLSGGKLAGDIDLDKDGGFIGTTASGNHFDIFRLIGSTRLQVGGSYPTLELKGKNERPTYNNSDVALLSDVLDPVAVTSSDGVNYIATASQVKAASLSELKGVKLVIIPNITSTNAYNVSLDVNGLGAKLIKRWDNTDTGEFWSFTKPGWFKAGYPTTVTFNGTYWMIEGMNKPYASDLSGSVAIANGGTGATTLEGARTNLGIPKVTYSTSEPPSTLADGEIWLVYE